MKKWSFFLLTSFAASAFALEAPQWRGEESEENKLRVQSHQVWIGPDGEEILVEQGGKWRRVPSIHRDRGGLYVYRDGMAEDDFGIAWTCFDCGAWNWGVQDICRVCGNGR